MQSERWYLLDHPEYIENSDVVGRYGGANTRLVNVYVLKDGISPTIQVQPFTSTRDFNYVPTITAASWTQKHEGTGDRGILQKGRQGYLRLSCEQRQEQDKSGARLPTTRVSYAPRASRNSLHSHENDLSNRPHFLWVYRRDNSRGMFGEHEKSL